MREAITEGRDLDSMIEERDRTIAELEALLRDAKGGRLKDVQPEKF